MSRGAVQIDYFTWSYCDCINVQRVFAFYRRKYVSGQSGRFRACTVLEMIFFGSTCQFTFQLKRCETDFVKSSNVAHFELESWLLYLSDRYFVVDWCYIGGCIKIGPDTRERINKIICKIIIQGLFYVPCRNEFIQDADVLFYYIIYYYNINIVTIL